jgi:type IX secretion system PorP/SprF family membrane protein
MKNKLPILLFTLILGNLSPLTAQDPQLIQFYAAPLQLNPAMTGVHPGAWRIAANFRQQWNSILDTRPFQTMSASFDGRNRLGRGDYIAYGVTAMRDQAGTSNYLRTTGDLGISYIKQLDGGRYGRGFDQFLIGGVQAGLGQHSLDFQKLWFSSQFDNVTEQIDLTRPSEENIAQNSGIYMNINTGLLWYAVFDDNKSLYFGGALHHINAPKVSFIEENGEEALDRKWTVHAGGEIPFSPQLSILPAIAVIGQGPSLISLFGTNFRYTNRDWHELAVRIGSWGHLVKDFEGSVAMPAVTFTAILEMERWNFGVSYDVNANKLAAPTNGRGALELSLIYYHPAERREKVRCPKL